MFFHVSPDYTHRGLIPPAEMGQPWSFKDAYASLDEQGVS